MYHPANKEPIATATELGMRCRPALEEVRRRAAVKYSGVLYTVEKVSAAMRKLLSATKPGVLCKYGEIMRKDQKEKVNTRLSMVIGITGSAANLSSTRKNTQARTALRAVSRIKNH
jgi:hypothetical protein